MKIINLLTTGRFARTTKIDRVAKKNAARVDLWPPDAQMTALLQIAKNRSVVSLRLLRYAAALLLKGANAQLKLAVHALLIPFLQTVIRSLPAISVQMGQMTVLFTNQPYVVQPSSAVATRRRPATAATAASLPAANARSPAACVSSAYVRVVQAHRQVRLFVWDVVNLRQTQRVVWRWGSRPKCNIPEINLRITLVPS